MQDTVLLILLLGGKPGCSPVDSSLKCVDTKLYTLAEFVLSTEIDNINLYKLLEFCEKSRIAHKVRNSAQLACRYSPGIVCDLVHSLHSGLLNLNFAMLHTFVFLNKILV
jgi:hypothetical protein